MRVEALIVPGIFLAFALVEMWRTDFFHKRNQTRADAWVEIVGSVVLLAVTQPAILLMAYALMALILPNAAGAWAGLPILAQIALFEASRVFRRRFHLSRATISRLSRAA